MSNQLIILLPVIIGVVLAVVLLFVARGSAGGKVAATRLDILVGKKRTESTQDLIIKKEAFDSDRGRIFEAFKSLVPNLQKIFEQADANIQPSSLVMAGVVLGLVGVMASWWANVPIYFWPASFLVLFLVPFGWLWNKRRTRLNAFAALLSDAMELIARALRAGHSLAAGMHVVAEEMPPPISDEFRRVYDEQNLGITIEEALKSMCERVPNLDLKFFVTSVIIQRQTGGDLAEILDKIGYIIRERFKILGQVKALTAEGRLSGVVLIALPFVLFLMMLHLKADYVALLWTDPKGIKMSVIALIMQVVGALVIKKIIDIKV
jgi:tight adherence protein B